MPVAFCRREGGGLCVCGADGESQGGAERQAEGGGKLRGKRAARREGAFAAKRVEDLTPNARASYREGEGDGKPRRATRLHVAEG